MRLDVYPAAVILGRLADVASLRTETNEKDKRIMSCKKVRETVKKSSSNNNETVRKAKGPVPVVVG